MLRGLRTAGNRHAIQIPYLTDEMREILDLIRSETGDRLLAESVRFSPTALTLVRRVVETGGTVITDTAVALDALDRERLEVSGAKAVCFIDEENVIRVAEQRRITRAEIAVDYGLSLPGPKLLVIAAAPAAMRRVLERRQTEPLNDVCVFAAANGFAGAVQLKERMIDSDMASIVIRGKMGGVAGTVAVLNVILRKLVRS